LKCNFWTYVKGLTLYRFENTQDPDSRGLP
jgi:hypothetical protein